MGVSTDISSSTLGSARESRYSGTFCRLRGAACALPIISSAASPDHVALVMILRKSMFEGSFGLLLQLEDVESHDAIADDGQARFVCVTHTDERCAGDRITLVAPIREASSPFGVEPERACLIEHGVRE